VTTVGESKAVRDEDASRLAADRLGYRDTVFINLRYSRQWVDIKLFSAPPEAADHEVLALLVAHPRYRDSYAGVDAEHSQAIHGPYRLEAITTAAFSAVSAESAEGLLRTWATYDAPLDEAQSAELDRELYARVRSASSRYQLADLRDTGEHDWGYVVGTTGFWEFVLIDRSAGGVALVVASDD
jgi:hypothetical protein